MDHSCFINSWIIWKIVPEKKLPDVIVFDGSPNVQLYYPKLTDMRVAEQTVSLFFNDVSKVPFFHQITAALKVIYNIFCSGTQGAFHDSFPRFACMGYLIFRKYQNQFCTCSAHTGHKCELGSLFDTNMPVLLRVGDWVLDRDRDTMF